MLDDRVYRAAFAPVLVVLFVVAFSLRDRPVPSTTRIVPDAFDVTRAYGKGDRPPRNSLRELQGAFPSRRPGSTGDFGLADRVAAVLSGADAPEPAEGGRRAVAFDATPQRFTLPADTVDGKQDLRVVLGVREGLSSRRVVVVAHRDALGAPAVAELSATAGLMELARVFADRDLPKTLVLASVSGGSGGLDGARAVARRVRRPVDAVIVLGDLASRGIRKPVVVPWSLGSEPAPHVLRRTVEAALRVETGEDPGGPHAPTQWVRRAFPLALGEQGPLNEAGLPTVRISASGERGPAAGAPVSRRRMEAFGRGSLRAVTALLEEGDDLAAPEARGIVTVRRLLPDWSVRALVGVLLLPALLAALDAAFRSRRRRERLGPWLVWALTFALPFVLAFGWLRALDVAGALRALPAPARPGTTPVGAAEWLALVGVVAIVAGGLLAGRPALLRALGFERVPADAAAGVAVGLVLCALATLVWLLNPYAAAMLVPATHAWLLVVGRSDPPSRRLAAVGIVIGLSLPILVGMHYAAAFGIDPAELVWLGLTLAAGGTLGPAQALALCVLAGTFAAVLVVARSRRASAPAARPRPTRTRGPGGYAGPGSLGGTESALRR